MKKLIIICGILYFLAGCDTPGTTTGTSADSTSLNPNRTKVETDTTMHKDSTRRDSLR